MNLDPSSISVTYARPSVSVQFKHKEQLPLMTSKEDQEDFRDNLGESGDRNLLSLIHI